MSSKAAAAAPLTEVLLQRGEPYKGGDDADYTRAERVLVDAQQRHHRYLVAAASVLVIDIIVTGFLLFGGALGLKFSRLFAEAYVLDASLGDALIILCVRWVSLVVLVYGLPRYSTLGWWVAFFSLVLIVCKAVVFDFVRATDGVRLPWCVALFAGAIVMGVAEIVQGHIVIASYSRVEDLKLLVQEEQGFDMEVASGSKKSDEEDPRSRFYDSNPEERRRKLLAPGSRTFSCGGLCKIMRPYFWPKFCCPKTRIVATFLIMAASKASNILSPLFLGKGVQQLTSGQGVPFANLALYCGLRFASSSLRELQKIVYLRVKQTAFAEISETTFRHLHNLSLDWHLRKKMGQVLRIMDRGIISADNVMNYLVLYLLPSCVEFLITCVLFYVHFSSPPLAAVAVLSFVVYVIVTVQITTWRKKFRKKTNIHDNRYHDIATDSLINFETVKYFNNEEYEVGKFKEAIQEYQKHSVNTQASLSLLNSSQQLDIQLTTLVALMVTATSIMHQYSDDPAAHIGDFVAVNAYVLQLFTPLSFLGTIYSTVVQAFIDMGQLSDLLTLSPDVEDKPSARKLHLAARDSGARIEFRGVSFSYPSQPSKGLRDVSFVVEPGTMTAIVGPTGAGKSTISRLLFRFYDVNGGSIRIDGQDICNVTQASLRRSVGVVPQDTVLFNSTLLRNIQYGNVLAPFHQVEDSARKAQILDFINSLDETWDTKVGERGLKISGGEKQRVAIARCLLKNPPVVVLDEATSALDSVTEAAVQSALSQLGTGRTQLVIAHRLSTIRNADQIIVLDAGRIVERGTHAELIKQRGMYHNMWMSQLETQGGGAIATSTD